MTREAAALAVAIALLSTVVPVAEVSALLVVSDVLAEPREVQVAPAPAMPEDGHRVVIHFSAMEPYSSSKEAILRLVDASGREVMHAYTVRGDVYVSDGFEEDGTPRPAVEIGTVGYWSERLDVVLEGQTYQAMVVANGEVPVTVRTSVDATTARSHDTSPVAERTAIIHRLVHYPAGGQHEAITYDPLAGPPGWAVYDPEGAIEAPGSSPSSGHDSRTNFAVKTSWGHPHRLSHTPDVLAYAHVDVTSYEGRYVAEASVRPWVVGIDFPDGVPDHQAAIAGLAGPLEAPTVAWAISMAPVGAEWDRWSLFLIDADGHRTQVAPTWGGGADEWHRVRAFVDEEAGSLAIQVDGAENTTVADLDLPASHRLAVGDIWDGENLAWTGTGIGYYDNLAVWPWEVGT